MDSDLEATVFNIQKFSTEDGPGIRTTVFLKGCPMQCPWCHNPESISPEAQPVWHPGRCLGDHGCIDECLDNALCAGADGIEIDRARCRGCGRCAEFCPASALEIHGRTMTVRELFDSVIADTVFYDTSGGGVTLSGGEPLVQYAASAALLRMLRDRDVHTAVDTCGAVPERAWQEVLPWTRLVLFDIKTVDPEKHMAFTGMPFERIAKSAEIVAASGIETWVRTPVIPGYTDDDETIRDAARFVGETFDHCTRHDLLAFSNLCTAKYAQLGMPFALERTALLSADRMERLCGVARDAGSPHVRWSGPTNSRPLTEAGA